MHLAWEVVRHRPKSLAALWRQSSPLLYSVARRFASAEAVAAYAELLAASAEAVGASAEAVPASAEAVPASAEAVVASAEAVVASMHAISAAISLRGGGDRLYDAAPCLREGGGCVSGGSARL
ncbi:hypothetical protein EV715DRAFT_297952 [Schizophyllum commune]